MAKRVSRNSRISRSWDAWIREKLALKMLDLDSVMSPMSPGSGLQPPRNYHRMGMIPGSSTVEHSAVNRRVASSNLARGANSYFSVSWISQEHSVAQAYCVTLVLHYMRLAAYAQGCCNHNNDCIL